MKQPYMLVAGAVLCLLFLGDSLHAQENINLGPREFSKVGSGSGSFLTIPVGARAIGMGGGFAGIADDPTSLYWNPAGAMLAPGFAASYAYTSMFAGITHNFAGVVFPVGPSYKAGISLTSYGTDPITITDMFNQQGTNETYTVSDIAIGLTFAGQLTDQFSFGATGKLISLSFASLNASGVAFDVGTMYKPGLLGLRIGFAVENLSGRLKYTGNNLVHSGDRDPVSGQQVPDQQLEANDASLPLIFRAGISSNVMEGDATNSLLIGTEFASISDAPEHVTLGAEYTWNNLISARAGYQFGSGDSYGISGGIGLRYQTGAFEGSLDYAIRPHKTLGLINQVTASVRFQ